MTAAPNPVEQIGGLATTDDVSKADTIAWAKARVPQIMADANEVRNTDLSGQLVIELKSTGRTYVLDTSDTTTPDDGVNCIIDAEGDRFKIVLIAGFDGVDGHDPGFGYIFSTSTTDADPGAGNMRANNANLSAATQFYLSKTDRYGIDQSAALLAMDDSTNPLVKAIMTVARRSDGKSAFFQASSVTDASGYVKVSVVFVSGTTSFANSDVMSVQSARVGNAGVGGSAYAVPFNFAGDGTTVNFDLAAFGVSNIVQGARVLWFEDGIPQEYNVDYTTSGSVVTRTSAPVSDAVIFGVLIGDITFVEVQTVGAQSLYPAATRHGQLDGTVIGNMTDNGGNSAAFDQRAYKAAAACAVKNSSTDAYVGKNFTGAPKQISRALVLGSVDYGFAGTPGLSIVFNLRAKQTSPSSASDGTLLGTVTHINDQAEGAQPFQIVSNDAATAWSFVWIEMVSTATTAVMGQIFFMGPGEDPCASNYSLEGLSAVNDPSSPTTRMLMKASRVQLFNPLDGTVVQKSTSVPIPCAIDFTGAGGANITPYVAGDVVWFYFIWGDSVGLSTVNSLFPPIAGRPNLPAGYTHYCPAFPVVLSSTASLQYLLPEGGSSTLIVSDGRVSYKNAVVLFYTIAAVSAGSYSTPLDINFRTWMPSGSTRGHLELDPEQAGNGGPANAGMILGYAGNSVVNLSVYSANNFIPAAQNVVIDFPLPGGLGCQITWGQISGASVSPYTTVIIILGYWFSIR